MGMTADEYIVHLRAERDRLAAENAELRKWKADLEANVAAASKIGLDFGEMEFDAWFPGSRPKTRKELTAELAAANATLNKLREEFKHDCGCLATCCANARAIIYPTPETTDEDK